MSVQNFSMKVIFDSVKEQMIEEKGNQFKPNYILLKDRLHNEYLVSLINLENCIKDDHIIFCSYLPKNDIADKKDESFGVAVPIGLYAGIELFSSLPKHLDQKFKNKGTKIGFERAS